MMALYTNKMDVFDYATLLAYNNYVAKSGVFIILCLLSLLL